MEDRFRIKRKREIKISKEKKRLLVILSIFIFFILILYFSSPKGKILKDGIDVPLNTSNIEIFNGKIIYSSSKTLYVLNDDFHINFSYFIIDFKIDGDKIYILSDHITILDSNFKIIKEIKKDGYVPSQIYFFSDKFSIRWDGKDSLKLKLSLYNKNNYKEVKSLNFDNLSFIPFTLVFNNGEKILLFQNDGDTILINFSGEIIWQKNIRPENIIVFDPHGAINENENIIILYWRSYAYNTNAVLVLNMDGEIIKSYDFKNSINKLFLDSDNLYLITNKDLKIVTNKIIHSFTIPFYKPKDSFFINDNLITVWELENFLSNYKILKINEKSFLFNGDIKDILIENNKLYVLINSKIYTINLYD